MTASTQRSPVAMLRWARLGVGVFALLFSAAAAYDSLPTLFMVLAAIMALLALAALYKSLRQAFDDSSLSSGLRATLPERAALIDEKNALLRAIKDMDFEHEVGKLSDADFERLDRASRRRAKEVLRKLDEDLAPYLEQARQLVSEAALEHEPERDAKPAHGRSKKTKGKGARRDCKSCGTPNVLDAEWCKECGASMKPRACPSCAAENEHDAKFCMKCAAPMSPKEPAPPATETEPEQPEAADDSASSEEGEPS